MKLTFSILFALFAFCVFSQSTSSLKMIESTEFKDEVKSEEVLSIHTTFEGLTGIVRNGKNDLVLNIFDSSLNKIKDVLIPTEKKEEFYGNLCYGSTIKLFSVYSPSKKERVVNCYELNISDGTHIKTELFKTEVEKNQGLFSGSNKRETGFAMSPNGEYFVVSTDNIKRNKNSYTIRVYDSDGLNLLFEKSFQENEEKFYEANDLFIDDNATVFNLGKLYLDGRSQKKDGEANYDFVLNKITDKDVEYSKIDVEDGLHIKSLIISHQDGDMQLIGFYSTEKVGKIKGSLLYDVDVNNMTVSNNKSFQLPESVYNDLYNKDKANRKKDQELSSYYVDYVLRDGQNNTYLLAEEFFITSHYVSTGMNGAGYWYNVFHYNNVLVLKLDYSGELVWARSIFKRDTQPSYNAFLKNGELHIILNSGKTLTEKDDGRVKVSKGFLESTSLYDITFDDEGEVQYNKLQDNKGKTYYTPYYGLFNGDRFITIGSSMGKKQFLILE